MQWQDWVFSVGGFLILASLIPTLRGEQKPALTTGVMSFVLVAIFACTMATLGLWLSAFANALISLSWGTLALQRWQADRRSPVIRAVPLSDHDSAKAPSLATSGVDH